MTIQRNWQHFGDTRHGSKTNKTEKETTIYANKHNYNVNKYKQLEVIKNRTSFLCGTSNGHHNTELSVKTHNRIAAIM